MKHNLEIFENILMNSFEEINNNKEKSKYLLKTINDIKGNNNNTSLVFITSCLFKIQMESLIQDLELTRSEAKDLLTSTIHRFEKECSLEKESVI